MIRFVALFSLMLFMVSLNAQQFTVKNKSLEVTGTIKELYSTSPILTQVLYQQFESSGTLGELNEDMPQTVIIDKHPKLDYFKVTLSEDWMNAHFRPQYGEVFDSSGGLNIPAFRYKDIVTVDEYYKTHQDCTHPKYKFISTTGWIEVFCRFVNFRLEIIYALAF